ncbi:RNA-binding S4 domain-containing protein [Desmospora activa]|uniref:RNA-binding S4 domain-containing protein n=1 Tax=Desmospora activa TaxID=500615 RepID=UPI003CCC42E9
MDRALSTKIKDVSRTQIQKLIKQGNIQMNSQTVAPKYLLCEKDDIHFHLRDIICNHKPFCHPTSLKWGRRSIQQIRRHQSIK